MIKQGSLQYFCDRCKNPIEEDEVRTISILFDSGAGSYHYCPDCLKEHGFLSEGTKKQSPEIDRENERILRRQIFKILKELGVPVEKQTMVKFSNIYRQKVKQKKKRIFRIKKGDDESHGIYPIRCFGYFHSGYFD